MAKWCAKRGAKTERPYFSLDGKNLPTAEAWDRLRAKWTHTHGMTNVWSVPPVHNGERVRVPGSSSRYLHANQKPLALMERQILACTSQNDVVWEPFGGLCSATVAAVKLGRIAHAAELNKEFLKAAVERVRREIPTQQKRMKRVG
jgi:site-specific DNA-methyltransferase (adenine-specific)